MTRSFTTSALRRLSAALALGALTATASAQVPGLYIGTLTSGGTIEMTFTDNGLGGADLTGVTVFWNPTCTVSGTGRITAWGIGTQTPVPTGQRVQFEFRGNSLYERFRFVASGTAITGDFLGRTPEFADVSRSTTRVELCDSGLQSFNASWVPPAAAAEGASARPGLQPGQAVRLR